MKKISRITSDDNKRFMDIFESVDGTFSLQSFVKKFDYEEEVEYIVRQLPNPSSVFGDLSKAIEESRRILTRF